MSIITGKHLPRRTFLRGLGAVVALPLLDSMRPALAAAKPSPMRIAFTYVPNGVIMKDWKPAVTGTDFAFTRILKPLEPFRKDLLVLSGLDHHQANALGDGGGGHARAGACFLTGVHPKKTRGSDIQAGVSADQIAAAKIGAQTRFASLELGCDDSRIVGSCDSGYSCAYTNSISWKRPSTPLPPEINPRIVFERLFGSDDVNLAPEERARRNANRNSILDLVQEDTTRINGKLGSADKRKLDEYLSAVREVEKRIEAAEKDPRDIRPGIDKPSGIPVGLDEYLKLMFDLQVIAFRTDLTRVSTLMVGREGSRRVYPEIGIPDPHHPLSHHQNQQDWIDKLAQINTFHVGLFAYLLDKLKTTQDGEGTLMDNVMVVYASGISDGNRHTHEDLPVLVAGRAQGQIKPGRHIQYAPGTPMTNLYMSMLGYAGVPVESVGDSNGRLQHLSDM